MITSALVREVIVPAPLLSGVATTWPPTRPRWTLRNSSWPSLEGSGRAGTAATVSLSPGVEPCISSRAGRTNLSKQTQADTG